MIPVLMFAATLVPMRPGGAVCNTFISKKYRTYNQCRNNDVVLGVQWDGQNFILNCGTLQVLCSKNYDRIQQRNHTRSPDRF